MAPEGHGAGADGAGYDVTGTVGALRVPAGPLADQTDLVPHPAQKIGPGQTPRALGVVGASDVVSVGRPLIYSAQQQVEPWLGGGVLDPGPVCLGRGCRS